MLYPVLLEILKSFKREILPNQFAFYPVQTQALRKNLSISWVTRQRFKAYYAQI